MASSNYLSVMKKVFGFESFLSDEQEAAFRTIQEGQHKNVFISLKSQGGKSFCYQLQGALQDRGIILVISPSLVVIKAQIAYLNAVALRAESINSRVFGEEREQIMNELRSAECQIRFLFVTPSMIISGSSNVQELINEIMLQDGKISYCFIDDVVKGGDFRPNLANLSELRKINSNVPWIILTTASENAIQAMKSDLGIARSFTVKGSSVRNDIFYSVVTVESAKNAVNAAIVKEIASLTIKNKGVIPRGLIYFTMNDWEPLTSILNDNGIGAKSLFSKLENKNEVQQEWLDGKFPVLVTTREYFGYGIKFDFPVEFVFHANSPGDMAAFYQESGRARGTPARPARSSVFRVEDEGFFYSSYERGMAALRNYETSAGCRVRLIEAHFDDKDDESTFDCQKMCDNCVRKNQQ